MLRSFSSTVSHVVVWPPLSFFTFLLASCNASFASASSGSLMTLLYHLLFSSLDFSTPFSLFCFVVEVFA